MTLTVDYHSYLVAGGFGLKKIIARLRSKFYLSGMHKEEQGIFPPAMYKASWLTVSKLSGSMGCVAHTCALPRTSTQCGCPW